jgi:K+-transporting ATPase ATPase A chain
LGIYLFQILDPKGKTFLDPVLKPLERLKYRLCGVDPDKEQSWILYTFSLLLFSVVTTILTYLIMRFQNVLPLNLQNRAPVSDALAFKTAFSFVTNTNW